jgi:uncharacterized protein YceK
MRKLLILVCFTLLSACSSIPLSSSSSELLTQYATIKFINSGEIPLLRARAVVEIAREGKRLFDTEKMPIAEIETLIRNRIKWDELKPEDILLANALINRVSEEIQSSDLPQDKMVSGSKVLGWIIAGAQMVGG